MYRHFITHKLASLNSGCSRLLGQIMAMLLLMVGFIVPLGAAEQQFNEQAVSLLKQTIAETSSFEDRFDAEVWLTDMSHRLSRFVKDEPTRLRILKAVHAEAMRYDLEPEWVLAVMQVESAFDPYALSIVGAQGLMQVMPFWRKEMGNEEANLMHIETNIGYGCAILKTYLKIEKGRLAPALARYNGSYGKFKYPKKVFKALRNYWY